MRFKVLIISVLSFFNAQAQVFQSGKTYLSANDYIEYRAGNLPIIITAPHGGRLEPASIPDRTCAACTTVMDANTQELASQLDTALRQTLGCVPHIIISRLHRKKLDPNREIVEAAGGNAQAEQGWQAFHQYVQAAKDSVLKKYGKGLLIDLHGHGHTIQRLELGYLLDDPDLRLADSALTTTTFLNRFSVKNMVKNNPNRFNLPQILRGVFSLGTLLENEGYPSVPSMQQPFPKLGEDYFNGGYITSRHGSRDSTALDAIQIECNLTGVRDNYTNRRSFSLKLASVIKQYLGKHYFTNTNFACLTAEKAVFTEGGIVVYPNPFLDVLTIENTQNMSLKVSIFNTQGVLVHDFMLENGKKTVSLSHLVSGVYIVKSGMGVLVEKIVKL
jgi:N-formylglutamate amidohydrolase